MIKAQPSARQDSSINLQGDRMYGVLRWLPLLIIGAFGIGRGALSPGPGGAWLPTNLAFWGYALFIIASSALFYIPSFMNVLPWLYTADLLGLAVLASTAPGRSRVYDTLLLLPLTAVALRFRRPAVLLFSVLGAVVSVLIELQAADRQWLTVAGRAITFFVVPLLVHLLFEQWSAGNLRVLEEREQQAAAALEHAEQYRGQMRALYDVASALSSTTNTAAVLDAILNECARLIPYTVGAVLLPTENRDELGVAAGRNLHTLELQSRFVVEPGAILTILRGGTGGVLPDANRRELRKVASLSACRTLLLLPLRLASRTYGLVVLGSDEPQVTGEQMDMALTVVSYGTAALQNARLLGELRAERNAQLDGEDELRRRLNRDLHDGPAQALAAITMNLEFVKRLLDREPARVPDELDKLIRMSQQANKDVRTLLFELRPMTLETQGLVPTLELYFERFKDNPTKVILQTEGDLELLDRSVQSVLFNIIQETVSNALKHAQAAHLWVRLRRTDKELTLEVEDDGKGFDVSAVLKNYAARGSFGLVNIDERARMVDGTADIRSTPGKGTHVLVRIPLN